MSHNQWGGGSDADPKLRLREREQMKARLEKAYGASIRKDKVSERKNQLKNLGLWIAFAIVLFIGYKMMHENQNKDSKNNSVIVPLQFSVP